MAVSNVLIRAVRPEDAEGIASLLTQLGYPADAGTVRRRLERLLESGSDHHLVAVDGEDVVGIAGLQVGLSLEYDGVVGKLSELCVDEARRRQGIGEALVAAIEDEARDRGCVLLYLTTAERRKDAHAFYDRIGFEETGRRFAKTLE
jgi:GNAT superfamily N-acetyltransferase